MTWARKTAPARWVVAPEPDRNLAAELAAQTNLSLATVKILINRGRTDAAAISEFFDPKLESLRDPFELGGMRQAVDRLAKAFFENESVMIYGDYDVDGITATTLLYMVLNKLGAKVDYHLPNRLTDGYGLSRDGIDSVHKRGATLIVTVDTGITAVEEIEYARSLGIDVVITDHHEPASQLPAAHAIVNPKLDKNNFGHELAGVGVAYKLSQALYRALKQDERELEQHLDLVALGTAADIVPLVDENRVLTHFGIRQIACTTKPGLKSLAFVSGLMGKDISTGQVVFILAPRINALGRLGDAREAVRLLSTRDEKTAQEIARTLDHQNRKRKEIDEVTLQEALQQLGDTVDLETDRAVVLSSEDWHLGVIGIVASRIVERYHLPTVMISVIDGEGKGSARSIPGFHLCEALKECEHLLVRYGGHKYAAGLSIKPEMIEPFRKKFIEVSGRFLTDDDVVPKLNIDQEIELTDIDDAFMDSLELFAPFGPQNMRPVFMTRNCDIVGQPYIVGNNHLRMRVQKGGSTLDVIGFGLGELVSQISSRGCLVDIVYALEYNTYNDITRKQIRLKDLKLTAGTASPVDR